MAENEAATMTRGSRLLRHFGVIPKHWEDVAIGDVFHVQLGKMLSQKSKSGLQYCSYLGNWNVKWGEFDLTHVEQMDFDADELVKFSLRRGDLLVCEGGEVGRTAIWNDELTTCCYQKALHRLRPKADQVLPAFFRFYMEEAARKNVFNRYTTESSIAHLSRETLIKIRIPLPPMHEQQRIASILMALEDTSKTTVLLIHQLRSLRSALLDTFVTQGLEGKATRFTRYRLGDLFNERKEQGLSGLRTLSITIGEGLVDRESLDRRIVSDLTPHQHLLVRKNDIAYNMMRMWQGVFGFATADGIVSPAYVVITPGNRIDSQYASYLFKHPSLIRLFERFSQGLTADRLRLYFEQFSAIHVSIPDLKTQKTIATSLKSVDDRIEAEEQRLLGLSSLKAALSQCLLSGRISVKS